MKRSSWKQINRKRGCLTKKWGSPKKYKPRLGTKDCTRAGFWRKIEENYHYVEEHEQLSLFVKPSNHEQKRNGYAQEVTIYECADCKNCLVKEKCIRQKKTDKTPLEDRVKRLNVSKYFIAQREAMEK